MKSNKYARGVLNGVCSGALWGMDTVLMGIVGTLTVFNTAEAAFVAAFVTAFFHDAFSAMWTFIYLASKKQMRQLIRALKTKSALFVALAAILGGPVGMSGYLLAIKFIGPSYTAIISSLYPAVGAILSFVILKERINKKAWIGLTGAVIGVILLGYTPGNSSMNMSGFLCAFLCVIGWGSECVISAYGMKDEAVTSEFALQIRQFTSAVVYGFFVIPIAGAAALSFEVLRNNALWCLFGTALAGTASYLCYYGAIYKIGPTKAMGLNITYVVWAFIFEKLFITRKFVMSQDLKTIFCCEGIIKKFCTSKDYFTKYNVNGLFLYTDYCLFNMK